MSKPRIVATAALGTHRLVRLARDHYAVEYLETDAMGAKQWQTLSGDCDEHPIPQWLVIRFIENMAARLRRRKKNRAARHGATAGPGSNRGYRK